jgi:very-short-patch-repair endonuclease
VTTPPSREARERRIDAELARLAEPQHGLISWLQLLKAGLTPAEIKYRVKVGRLHRIHRGVYAVGHRPPSPHARAMAAVLACGEGAVLSHQSAARLWGIQRKWRGAMHVSGPGRHRHRGVQFHETRTLTPHDITIHYGIPVTTPARTVLDLADTLDDPGLTRAINEAQLVCRLTLEDVAAILVRSPGRRAAKRLKQFVQHADAPTRSTFEDGFLAFTERYDIERPEVNQHIEGHEVDMLWREQRLIVELDSRTYHERVRDFEADREKDADLLAAGFRVLRITWQRFTQRPDLEAARLVKLLTR